MHCCLIHALACCLIHLCQHNGSSIIPIFSYYHNNYKRAVKAQDITSLLRQAGRLIGPDVGLCKGDMSARSMHAGGAMAFLCVQVNGNTIKLISHCQSDLVMRYLNIQARPIMHNFSAQILQHGTYKLVPNYQH
jgi:hypothetical protein